MSGWDEPERIERAAYWHKGIVYSVPAPGRHHHVIKLMREKHGLGIEAHLHDGFYTSAHRFVGRKVAWKIAEAAGQLIDRAPTDGRGGTLYSEDVW